MMQREQKPRRSKHGLTLVEAVMSCLVVSLLLVAALRAASAASLYQYKTADRARARFLAGQLMTDIMSLSYEDPLVTPLFGLEAGELSTSKGTFDDVDDFNGWTESPPQDRDGNAASELTGWQRSVAVAWVSSANLSTVSATETGVKRVTVTVKKGNQTLATRVAIKVKAP
jgi:type II secretory pathway pseudopilin PulG